MNDSSTTRPLRLGMIGLGRMGLNMLNRLRDGGVDCVGYDPSSQAREAAVAHGGRSVASLAELVRQLPAPRAIWMMVPSGAVDHVLEPLLPLLEAGDIIIDGGNSHYVDDIRRARQTSARGIEYVDVGVSGGTWGYERGYCQMIGGSKHAFRHLEAAFIALAPGHAAAPRSPGRKGPPGPAEQGYLHCGPAGAGHFVKMVHNGIEYGLMAAYAEGLNILKQADAGLHQREQDAETTPLEHPEHYRYPLPVHDIVELWRRGSVVGSWLLDLTAIEMAGDPQLENYSGRVSDSGEGRWTALAAIEEGVPAPVLSAALFARFSSRDNDLFANKVMSAMRHAFGGHHEKHG